MKTETADSFIDYRRSQEILIRDHGNRQSESLAGLLTIEINLTELCNRTCSFCPRSDSDVYPNRNLMIPDIVIDKIISEIRRLGYNSKVSFSGFGEPILNSNLVNIVKQFREECPDIILETNTNGDKLDSDLLNRLYAAGLNSLYWNLYDGSHQIESIMPIIESSMFPKENIKIRPHWEGVDNSGLILNNRSGAVTKTIQILPLKKGCTYPFYKMFIDWNGNVLSCTNDWLRKFIVGNVLHTPLEEIWNDERWHEFRTNLIAKDRSKNSPCNTCDVDGGLYAEESIRQYMALHEAKTSV